MLGDEAVHEFGNSFAIGLQELSHHIPDGYHVLKNAILIAQSNQGFRKCGWLISKKWGSKCMTFGATSYSCWLKLRCSERRTVLLHSVYQPNAAHGMEVCETALIQFFGELWPVEANNLVVVGDFQICLGTTEHTWEESMMGNAFVGQSRSPMGVRLLSLLRESGLHVASSRTDVGVPSAMRPTHIPWKEQPQYNIVARTIDFVFLDEALVAHQTDNFTAMQFLGGHKSDHVLTGVSVNMEEKRFIKNASASKACRPAELHAQKWADEVKQQWSSIPASLWAEDAVGAMQLGLTQACANFPKKYQSFKPGARRRDERLQNMRQEMRSTDCQLERCLIRNRIRKRCRELRKIQKSQELQEATRHHRRHRAKPLQAMGWQEMDGYIGGTQAMLHHEAWWKCNWNREVAFELTDHLYSTCGNPTTWEGTPVEADVDIARLVCETWRPQKAGDHLGCTHESLQRLDDESLSLVCSIISWVWTTLQIPWIWKLVHVRLLSKHSKPKGPKDFRPISLINVTARLAAKVALYKTAHLWERLPDYIMGFRRGVSTDNMIFILSETVQRAKEWHRPLVFLKIDLSRAFDCVPRSLLVEALLQLHATPWEIFALMSTLPSEWILHWLDLHSDIGKMTNGVPQGSSTSPAFFNAVIMVILERIRARCFTLGLHYQLDDFILCCLAWADDIIFATPSLHSAHELLHIIVEEFTHAGFKINPDKTVIAANVHARVDEVFHWEGQVVPVTDVLPVLGVLLDLGAASETLLDAALARGLRTFWACRSQLTQKTVHIKWRVQLLRSCVYGSALHGLNAVLWTHALAQRVARWTNGLFRLLFPRRRRPRQPWLIYFRSWTHSARCQVQRWGIPGLLVEALKRQHRWAGHVSRSTGLLHQALKHRDITWWRGVQQLNETTPRPHQLRHPSTYRH
eukprot:6485351-Amphidinium_carterae.2